MNRRAVFCGAWLAAMLLCPAGAARAATVPVTDIHTWTSVGDGTWSLTNNNTELKQNINSSSNSYKVSPTSVPQLDVTFEVKTTDADDDGIGAVFMADTTGKNYYLFHWSNCDNNGGAYGGCGRRLYRYVNGTQQLVAS